MSESLPATVTDWMRARVAELEADRDLALARVEHAESTLAAVLRAQRYTQARCTELVEELRALRKVTK